MACCQTLVRVLCSILNIWSSLHPTVLEIIWAIPDFRLQLVVLGILRVIAGNSRETMWLVPEIKLHVQNLNPSCMSLNSVM